MAAEAAAGGVNGTSRHCAVKRRGHQCWITDTTESQGTKLSIYTESNVLESKHMF